jgi:benzoate membrane transport protein
VWTAPQFSWAAFVGIALPLFVVTMASQNLPGVAAQRAAGYATPVSASITATGAATVLFAPFGGYAFNLAAITAAIAMSPEAHADPARRYTAAVMAGVFYVAIGLAAALRDEAHRDAAILTFVVTLSGVTLLGIGSAFWGVVAGAFALLVRK